MKKIRVFHLITRFIQGGADENTLLTVIGLDKRKYDVWLGFGKEYDKEMVENAEKAGVKTVSSPLRHFNYSSFIPSLIKLYAFFKQNKFDIVHTHSTEAGFVGRIAANLAGVPVIIHTVHGIAFTPYRSRLMNKLIITAENVCAGFTDRIITNADIIAKEYLKRGIGKREQYITVHSGIDLSRFSGKQKKQSKIPVITMIARLAKGKGHKDFIKSAKKVLEKKDAEFLIVGDGELRKKAEKWIGNESRIRVLGKRNDVPEIISKSDIIVVPSYWEGTPRVITEAMASKKPVIASAVGGIPEQVEDGVNGLLIKPGDVEDLAESIIYLIKNPEVRKKMGEEGKKKSRLFSAKEMVRKLDNIYAEIMLS